MDFDRDFELAELLAGADYRGGVLIASSRLRKVFELVERIAPFNVTVLIQGESGTGKELVASALHRLGPNPSGPFIALNCATLIGQLAESQLFGHVRGAFTDARENTLGYFRAAQGGTLFLDEIGELPLELQPKILRAVENHLIQSVGSSQELRVDVRLVAATNRNLRSMVSARSFREDLFHRLNAISVATPRLRECREAIGPLVAHFANMHSREAGKRVTHISGRALRMLLDYDWPGNVRELGHAMQSAILMTDDCRIDVDALPSHLAAMEGQIDNDPEVHVDDDRESAMPDTRETTILEGPADADTFRNAMELDSMTRSALLTSLERTRGNREQAAKMLGISRQKLYRMIARYELEHTGRQD
jgi:DNA-binding NtrC family response regulator